MDLGKNARSSWGSYGVPRVFRRAFARLRVPHKCGTPSAILVCMTKKTQSGLVEWLAAKIVDALVGMIDGFNAQAAVVVATLGEE